ncbi:MAG: UDP-2,3-diacylglucosamine diphosphatase [Aureispira sp.]|nr:UDP-2,3-diacylglucosamine diphosphatase [Aureispira sp.]
MMKKIYFASDFHLGTPSFEASQLREQLIIKWLDSIADDAQAIYLVGDIFDFWFEYKTVIPKGYIRFLGKIAQLKDKGIDIQFFTGNHDIWMFDYFTKELGIPVHTQPIQVELLNKNFLIGHGDGLGPGDHGYKRLKKIFTNRLCQWFFKWLHPDIGVGLANFFSRKSRAAQKEPERYLGADKEWLLLYANGKVQELPQTDFFIFGHRHLPLDIRLQNKASRYINLGEWLNYNTYAVFNGEQLELKAFENPDFDITKHQHQSGSLT